MLPHASHPAILDLLSLLEGDRVFFNDGGDGAGGGGSGDGGAQDGADGSKDDGAGAQDGAGGDGSPGGAGDDDALTLEAARKLRSESQSLRKRLRETEIELQKRKDADLSDQQKLERDKQALEAKAQQLEHESRDLRAQLVAARIGIRPEAVEDAVRLLDWSQVDDASDRKQVEAALKQLVKDKPYLSGRTDGLDGGAGRGSGAGSGSDMTSIIRHAAGRR